jgi:predicted amidophosphoribosyltransferase
MPDQDALARLSASLVARAGGYLRNPVRRDHETCAVCTRPCAGSERCYPCRQHRGHQGLADATAFLTYAVAGRQSGHVMRGYKATPQPVGEHRMVVHLLAALGLAGHAQCPGLLAGMPVTHWATVPSLPARPGEHPLHKLVAGLAPGREVGLTAAAQVRFPRGVRPEHFRADETLPPDSHVLLMDDTWTSGGHAQSGVLALRAAGAKYVSLLVVARWLNREHGSTAKFLAEPAGRDYDPAVCPWTGGGCPSGQRESSV